MTTANKEYFVFIGIENRLTGPANPYTGDKSVWGSIYKTENKELRDMFMKDNACEGVIIVPGGRRVMRRYRLGLSVREFHEYLNQCGFMYKNVSGEWHAGN